jgi:hypothetical protein
MLSENTISFLSSFLISLMGLFRVCKKTQIDTFVPNRNMNLPFLAYLMPRYANIPRFVIGCFRPIHAILLMRYFAQIAQTVIGPVPIYMVYLPKRPKTIFHSHDNSMCWDCGSIDANLNISVDKSASGLTSLCPLCRFLPCQTPGNGVIGKFFVQRVYGNFSHCNVIPHFLNGGKYGCFIG